MTLYATLNLTLILIGLCGLFAGAFQILSLVKKYRIAMMQWEILLGLLCFFAFGYFFHAFEFIYPTPQKNSHHLLISTIYFSGGIFVFMVMKLITKTLKKLKNTKELELINKQLRYISERDYLTDVYKRQYFDEALRKIFLLTKKTNKKFAVFYIDINDFKKINDCHGHLAGDSVLTSLALTFKKSFRKSDIIARLGGDEFAVLMEIRDNFEMKPFAELLMLRISKIKTVFENKTIAPTISIGIAIISHNTKTIDDILHKADRACYKAKTKKHLNQSYYVILE